MASSIFWNTLAEDFTKLSPAGGLILRWQFTGGMPGKSGRYSYSLHSNDLDHHHALVVKFNALAERAGAALGNPRDSVTAWYTEIRTNHKDPRNSGEPILEVLGDGTRIWHQLGKIPDACQDSATRCLELAMTEAKAEQIPKPFELPQRQRQPVDIATIRSARSRHARKSEPTFPKRAKWLREKLRERSWDKNDLRSWGGPDRKTIQKILDGFPVRQDVLERLAQAFSRKDSKPGVLEIPQG